MLIATTARIYPPEMDTTKRLERTAAAGFDGIELNLEPEEGLPLPLEADTARGILAHCRRLRLRVASVYSRAQWDTPIASPDPEIRRRGQQILLDLIHAAEALECEAVLVIPGLVDSLIIRPDPRHIIPYEECWKNTRAVIDNILPAAERVAVTLCLENVSSKFIMSPLEFRRFTDMFDSPNLKAYFDIANALNYGFPEHWIRVLGERIFRVHVKDARPSLWPINAVVNLFDGEVNWPLVARQFAEIGYDCWLTAEVLPPWRHFFGQFVEQLRHNMDLFRQAIENNLAPENESRCSVSI